MSKYRRIPREQWKPKGGSASHKFTVDECSDGGANARYKERVDGKKLNHGVTFGKRDR